MEILILISILTWIPWKNLSSPLQSAILQDLKKWEIQIYNSEVPDRDDRKTRRRTTITETTAK